MVRPCRPRGEIHDHGQCVRLTGERPARRVVESQHPSKAQLQPCLPFEHPRPRGGDCLARLPSHVGTLLPMRWVTLAEVEAEPGYVRHAVVASAQGMPLPVLVNGVSDVETATR